MVSTQTKKAHETLMCEVNREAKYISTKYSIWIDPLYFEWNRFIPTLEKHFLDILGEILNHDNQRYASVQGQGQSIPANRHLDRTKGHSGHALNSEHVHRTS